MFGFYIFNNVRIGSRPSPAASLPAWARPILSPSNGVIIGAFTGYLVEAGTRESFCSFVAGHSALELLAIC